MIDIVSVLAREFSLAPAGIAAALQLHADGCTIPFIARYRKEQTGGMTEGQLRGLVERQGYFRELQQRKQSLLKMIETSGGLTDELRTSIEECATRAALDDLAIPFRTRRRTRAVVAREKGLEPLARAIASLNSPGVTEADLPALAAPYLSQEKGVSSVEEALAGASDILAEEIALKQELRTHLRDYILKEGVFTATVREKFPPGSTKFEMYRDYKVAVKSIQPHNLLALRRGERSGILVVSVEINDEYVQQYLESKELFAAAEPVRQAYRTILKEAFERGMRESLVNEVRAMKKEQADAASVRTFEMNVRDVLLAPPAGPKPTLGINPGLKPGCRLAVVDAAGAVVETLSITPHESPDKRQEAAAVLSDLLKKHAIELVAIGNGTASRETDQFVADVIAGMEHKPIRVTVSESAATVYASSKLAKEELPNIDTGTRTAVSLARRLQDPLTELTKIDPKAIGVGQYQHDVDQKLLKRKLEEIVQSCVTTVGADLNAASREVLRFVPGLGMPLASAIVHYRTEHGPFTSREQLRAVPQMTAKAFEQAVGFLRVHRGENPLDATGIHPESYPIVQRIAADSGVRVDELLNKTGLLKQIEPAKYAGEHAGDQTVRDILDELGRGGRDPRRAFRYATFKEGIKDLKDLSPGLELEGVVTNVTNFGAFVDVGVHHDGLVHVSQLADRYVADPKSVVKVGQVVKVRVLEVNEQTKRISLTMKGLVPQRPKKRPKKRPEAPRQERPSERSFTIEELRDKFNSR